MMTFALPRPPSANGLYRNLARRGRVKTKRYLQWIAEADKHYTLQQLGRCPPIKGPYEISIKVPPGRGDIDNKNKAILDWCVSRGLTPDDRHAAKVTIQVDPALHDCQIELRAAA